MGLSTRGITRILKVARTIADLEGFKDIQIQHLAEAIQYRQKRWGVLGFGFKVKRLGHRIGKFPPYNTFSAPVAQ